MGVLYLSTHPTLKPIYLNTYTSLAPTHPTQGGWVYHLLSERPPSSSLLLTPSYSSWFPHFHSLLTIFCFQNTPPFPPTPRILLSSKVSAANSCSAATWLLCSLNSSSIPTTVSSPQLTHSLPGPYHKQKSHHL